MAQLAQLALDAPVAPARVLLGQLHDQVMQLAAEDQSLAAPSSPVGGPLAVDQLPMPAQQRLRAGQQCSLCRPGQHTADSSQQQTISGLPARAPDLAFEYPKLVAQRQHLGAKLGVTTTADDQDFDQQTEQVVGEAVEHDRGSISARQA